MVQSTGGFKPGDLLSVADEGKLVPCTLQSIYAFNGKIWFVLTCNKTGFQYRRPEPVFLKSSKTIPKLAEPEKPQ